MNYDLAEFNQLVKARRSVFPKQFVAGKKIPADTVRQILENACCAPTHKLTEPWYFIVFEEEGLSSLAAFQSELYKASAGEKFRESKYQNLRENPLKASQVIAICMKRDPEKRIPEVEEIAAVSCAVENIYLSVTAYGLGGYWTTGGVTYDEKAKPFFGLGEDDRLLGFFYLGYVALASPPGKRRPLEEKMTWVRK